MIFGRLLGGRRNTELYKRAMQAYKDGRYAEAVYYFRQLMSLNGLQGYVARFYYAQSSRRLAEDLIEEGKLDLAIEYLNQAVKVNPYLPDLLSYLASCLISKGEYISAVENLDRLAEMDRLDSSTELKAAVACYLAGRSFEAIKRLEGFIREHPNNFYAVYYLGTFLAATGRYSDALLYLTKASRLRPEDPSVHLKLGLTHGLLGAMPQAIYHIQRAHILDPENNWILMHLALAKKQAEQWGINVEIELKRLDEIKAQEEDAKDKRLMYMDKLTEIIAKEPEFVAAFLDLPSTGVDKDIFSSLLKVLLAAIERYPEYADLHYHLSCVYQRLNRLDEAIEEAERSIRINPRYVNALIQLARLYGQTNQEHKAIDRLRAALAAGAANYPDVHYMLANLYKKSGDLDGARQHYTKALRLNPNYKEARDALEELSRK